MRATILLGVLGLAVMAAAPSSRGEREAAAGTALRLTVPELVERADLCFEGRVRSAVPLRDARGRIETEYELDVDRAFWGSPGQRVRLRFPGGVMGDGSGLVLPGMPRLRAGEDVVLFVSEPGATGVRMPVGLAQGKLQVVTSATGARALVRGERGLSYAELATGAIDEGAGVAVYDYAATIAEIRAAADRKRAGLPADGGDR